MKSNFLQKAGSPLFTDRYFPKATTLFTDWNGEESVSGPALIGVPLSKPSISHSGACFTPGTVRKLFQSYSTYVIEEDVDLSESSYVDFGDIEMHVTDVNESYLRIEESLSDVVGKHPKSKPVIIGGDHSITYSTLKGISAAKPGKYGVIQFDAHHDLRNVEDGGPTNGTPFRRLIEQGVISGENIVQIGIRNYSNSKYYYDYAKEQGITVFTMEDVRQLGMENVIFQAINILQENVDYIYISVDMDVLDQAYAPGCPAIGPGGLTSEQLLQAVHMLSGLENVQAIDIVEIDPTIDFRDMTSRVAVHVILEFLRGIKK
ncbi:formimidoylglutamase [Bacillus sp. FJAT-45066]|uniref:formimidoylglutamase n=1 Tax=Bacillus sp. FJAT-45066 TaxID=2011010 RepID=UPI000BB78089|nr:formimidoylglutamase [Bacillus sp. FJAT-45066]